jgi:hypothetical protein
MEKAEYAVLTRACKSPEPSETATEQRLPYTKNYGILAQARFVAHDHNCTLGRDEAGDLIVGFRGLGPQASYFTNDAGDAISTILYEVQHSAFRVAEFLGEGKIGGYLATRWKHNHARTFCLEHSRGRPLAIVHGGVIVEVIEVRS